MTDPEKGQPPVGETAEQTPDHASGSSKPSEKDAVVAVENDSPEKDSNPFRSYVKLWRYAQPIDIALRIVGALAAIAAGTALPLMTIVFGTLVNEFNGFDVGETQPDVLRSAINRNALWFVYLFIGKFITVYLHTTAFTLTATRATRTLRLEYIRATLRQDLTYFDTCSPGSVATKISNNANLIQGGLSEKVGVSIQGLAMLVSSFVVAFTRQWKLTLVTATTIPAAVIGVGITVTLDSKIEAKILDIYTKSGSLVEEALSSIRIITAFGAREKILDKNEEYLQAAKNLGIKKGPILGVMYSSEFFIMYCAYALAFWYGVRLLIRGEVDDGGSVLVVLFCVVIGTSSLTMIAPALGDFTKAAAAAKDILAMLEREPLIDSTSPEGSKKDKVVGEMELKEVSFAYPARPTIKVLDGISLKFPANKVTALVGASGCGKSTIVGLLERWYDPAEGQVCLDGEDVKGFNVRWLRSQIGLVQQEPVLFDDTIYTNVIYGLAGSEMDRLDEAKKRELVREACIKSYADEFIQKLPQGYDTRVGERGGNLSGGQKQRIAIARSIISDPGILLLDEATSALDPKAEGIVQAALDAVSHSRTTIMIAHRLSTVKKADKIIVLNKGRMVEEGTHESLLAAGGAYSRLVQAQDLASFNYPKLQLESAEQDVDERVPEDLEKLPTRRSSFKSDPEASAEVDVARKLSLMKCLSIIFYEQRRIWYFFALGFMGSLGGGAVFPINAFIFSRIVAVFQLQGSALQSRTNFWSLMFFILALGTLFSYASIGFFFTVAAYIVSKYYRRVYFSALLSQDISYFDLDGHSSGALTAQLATDSQHLKDLLSLNMGLILIVIVTLISSCAVALAIGWRLGLVAVFGGLPPMFFAGFTRMRMEIQSQDKTAKLYNESARFASEAVGAIRTVSSLTLEQRVYDNYGIRLQETVQKSYRHTLVSMIFFGLSESLELLVMGLCFWYGGQRLAVGEYSTTQFFFIFTAVIFGGQAAGFCFGYTLHVTKAHAAANRILDIRSKQPAINSSTGVEPKADGSEFAVEFKKVKFHYDTRPDIPVLRGIDFAIRQGQKVGFVGPSGCGKTTVIALLERFYDIKSGEILIHGQKLSDLDVKAYRSTVGLVSQETSLYQGSIRDNILLGTDEKVTDDELHKVCRDANILDFILSLPQGFDTDCGSRGLALSGGQRQRLAIARALIRNPRFLLLDEATSALDTESEKVVQQALETAARGRTTIAVAHRLSTVRDADQLFVLDSGRVAEHGTHVELMARRGRYWEMCQAQSLDREAT